MAARSLTIRSYRALESAADRLCTEDPALRALRAALGPAKIPLRGMRQGFESLLKLIVYQQISLAAARAIWARLEREGASVDGVARLGEARLKALGLSAQKARYAAAIAQEVAGRSFSFARLARLADDEARAALMSLPGIGPWTSELYLLQALRRADAFPAGDLALQEAARTAFGLPTRPGADALERIAQRWRPHRSVAARLLWCHYRRSVRGGREAGG